MSEDAFDDQAFVRRSAFDTDGERKTVIIVPAKDWSACSDGARENLFLLPSAFT